MQTPEAARIMARPMLRCRRVVVHGDIAQPEGRSGRPRRKSGSSLFQPPLTSTRMAATYEKSTEHMTSSWWLDP